MNLRFFLDVAVSRPVSFFYFHGETLIFSCLFTASYVRTNAIYVLAAFEKAIYVVLVLVLVRKIPVAVGTIRTGIFEIARVSV